MTTQTLVLRHQINSVFVVEKCAFLVFLCVIEAQEFHS
jgi:hypothetical protein